MAIPVIWYGTQPYNMSSSNGVNKLVPVFDSRDFCLWQEKISDYFKSQRLWKYISGAFPRPTPAAAGAPTAAEMAAIAVIRCTMPRDC